MFVRMKIYQTTYPPNIIRHITFTARLVLFKRAEICDNINGMFLLITVIFPDFLFKMVYVKCPF